MDGEEWSPLPKRAAGGWQGFLKRRLPILSWVPRYERTTAVGDFVAGITLSLTLVPQSIAYASLANVPMQYGLYSAFVGTILYMFFGTVKEVSIGPTSLMALLTLQTCRDLPIEFVVLLTFLSGCIVFLMGLLKLGFLVDLISKPVTSGFTSATAVIIVISQMKGLLGLSFLAESPFENIMLIIEHVKHIRIPDTIMAVVCCTTLLLLRKLKDIPVNPKRFRIKKTLWLISIARNALVVFIATTVAFVTYDPQHPLVKLSGRVEPGLPTVSLPPFSAIVGNQTVGFIGMVEKLSSGLIMIPLVMVLANIAIAKAFSEGGRVDATQEMLTLGLCNVAGSLFQAMPTCGAFTRSAVSQSSGVRSPAAGLYSGIITLLALNYLTKYFFFIPKACLSSVLVCAVVFMIDISTARQLWRESRRDAAVLIVTFFVAVCASVEAAVLTGVLAALAALVRDLVRPPKLSRATEKSCGREIVRVQPRRALVYINAERLASTVRSIVAQPSKTSSSSGHSSPIVMLDCSTLSLVDYAAVQVLERLLKEFEAESRSLIIYNASPDAARILCNVPGVNATLREPSAHRALLAESVLSPSTEKTKLLSEQDPEEPV